MAEQKIDPFMNDCYAFIYDVLGTGAWIPVYEHKSIPETKDELLLLVSLLKHHSSHNFFD
ncbi:MAG: hypothetical protein STSR0009_04590 [Methanoregula sp.]